ncbi:hypothetical protein ASD56_08965 [Microbacterium sp. Root166]|uniref:restriction endonuclease n=1 Tax=Microbacterium sp. Root166 TaxID=1736478 RepID=UPI0006FEEF33|nr:restriction endonuclease [Microbacterium sp. Root166]KQZ84134.1 hypothetical protein ASD56_08965 [Microbacterium sp. Root166]
MSELTTDEDPTPVDNPRSTSEWRQFELRVAKELKAIHPGADVHSDHRLTDTLSKTSRQIDALAVSETIGVKHLVVVECKLYRNKLGIGMVDEFIGKLIDVGAAMGVLYTGKGFSKNATARAAGQRIPQVELRILDPKAPVPETLPPSTSVTFADLLAATPSDNWADEANRALGFSRCANENCYEWEVLLGEWPSGELAGYCSSCGTLTYVCKECEEVLALESGANRCWGCNAQYDVAYDSGGEPTDIVQTGPPDK